MVCLDGFTLTHSLEPVETYDDQAVRDFVGEREGGYELLNTAEPVTVGPLALQDAYMDFRRALADAFRQAVPIIREEIQAFQRRFGRALPEFVETTGEDGAADALVVMGSYADILGETVARWRTDGHPARLIRVVTFRPFPHTVLAAQLAGARHVVVMERADTLSTMGGPLGIELRAALHAHGIGARVTDVIFGLGGRDLKDADLDRVAQILADAPIGHLVYLGVGEEETWR
jgi:pyruvate ferredoxin oxidoreductase alpha subunit